MVVMGLVGWALGTGWAADLPDVPCATLSLLPDAPPLRRGGPSPAAPALPGKELRDAFGVPNVRTSPNFAIWYGNAGGVTVAEVDRLLTAFELAWTVQVSALGHPAPETTDRYHFNVYIGDTGNNTPSGYGAGGYYWVDPLGYPMVVIANGTLGDPDFADHAARHEFYHAIQGSLDRYDYDFDGPAAWYWEATAEWAAIETTPGSDTNGPFVFSYLLLPHLPVNAFDYPDTGALQEYYQYGAFLFPHDLGRQLGPTLIRDSWIDPGRERDPLEVLRALVQAEGEDLDQLWLDHLGHNAAYDYDQGPLYRSITDSYAPFFPGVAVLLDTVAGAGGAGAAGGPDAPHRYGSATIALEAPHSGTLEVRITGQANGTQGSPSQYGARVVRMSSAGIEHLDVPFDGVEGSLDVPGVGPQEALFLAVGAWTPRWDEDRWMDERFPFDWSLTVVEAATTPSTDTTPGDDDDDSNDDGDHDSDHDSDDLSDGDPGKGGCGCVGAPGRSVGWVPLLALALAVGRRKERLPVRREAVTR